VSVIALHYFAISRLAVVISSKDLMLRPSDEAIVKQNGLIKNKHDLQLIISNNEIIN